MNDIKASVVDFEEDLRLEMKTMTKKKKMLCYVMFKIVKKELKLSKIERLSKREKERKKASSLILW